ncbi:MAG: rod shape-determining protein MreC [Pseudomonadota bacterium]
MARTLFADSPDSIYRLLAVVVVSLALLMADTRVPGWTSWLRSGLSPVTETMVVLVDLPRRAVVWVDEAITSRDTLAGENARLQQENLVLQRHVQRLAALTAENARLRELLNSSALLDSSVLVAEIIAFDPDPSRVEVIINKGADAGLYDGQPVLDASGIMGQLIAVGPHQSRVILITDARHGLPVEVSRNGVRSIAVGTGRPGLLSLQYLPITADVREGDLLVSSGLGGIFPRGYPVGRVSRVVREQGETFTLVEARPTAAIERSRHVLLVFAQQKLQGALMQNADAAAPVPAAGAVPAAEAVP